MNEIDDEKKDGIRVKEKVKLFLDELKDVFPDEMTKLPPAKEVDHAIDLVADATPIAKAPYRHSLA